jgi:hypothetical protein
VTYGKEALARPGSSAGRTSLHRRGWRGYQASLSRSVTEVRLVRLDGEPGKDNIHALPVDLENPAARAWPALHRGEGRDDVRPRRPGRRHQDAWSLRLESAGGRSAASGRAPDIRRRRRAMRRRRRPSPWVSLRRSPRLSPANSKPNMFLVLCLSRRVHPRTGLRHAKRKLEKWPPRLAPENRRSRARDREYWHQRLAAFSLNPGKAGGSPTPGNHDAETGLAG